MDSDQAEEVPLGIDPAASQRVFLGMLALIAGGTLAFYIFRPAPPPPPPEISADPLLVQGREIYLDRCASCHGAEGKGDGPTARGLAGPPVGNLTDDVWKHGDRPDQVRSVIAAGVKDAQMPAWLSILGAEGVDAVAAYVYYLAGREVPRELRGNSSASDAGSS